MVDKKKFKAQEEALGLRITVVGHNVYVTEAMKNYAYDKLSKIDRFHNHVMDLHVTLDMQKMESSVVILLSFDHFKVKVSAVSTDMYVSIDKAVKNLVAKIRRWKSRIQDHHRTARSAVDMKINVLSRPFDDLEEINADIEAANQAELAEEYAPPKVIGTDSCPLKTLTTEEAIMKMELSDDDFMLFKGLEDRKYKVIYRRVDGHYGLMVPDA